MVVPLVSAAPLFAAIPRCRPTRRRPRRPPLRSPPRGPLRHSSPTRTFHSRARSSSGEECLRRVSVVPECQRRVSVSQPSSSTPHPPSPLPRLVHGDMVKLLAAPSSPPLIPGPPRRPLLARLPRGTAASGQQGCLARRTSGWNVAAGVERTSVHEPDLICTPNHRSPRFPPHGGAHRHGTNWTSKGPALGAVQPVVSALDVSALDHAGTPTATTNHTRRWSDRGEPPPNPNPAPHSAWPSTLHTHVVRTSPAPHTTTDWCTWIHAACKYAVRSTLPMPRRAPRRVPD
jgi:hypothetical protein